MPENEATPEQRTNRVFELMDKDRDDRISLEEFLEGVQADPDVLQLLKLDTIALGVSATTGTHEHNDVNPVTHPQQQQTQASHLPSGKGAATV
ncbi:unnamed protein product [Dibothriocephalus latus]|uniref:EF-hand domain-containing protein n=1 Tax=Dibothriocephalus latus TaxID=60516 RepID=A0A3P7NK91_DIBLA|nr:unnamed protein product [Dibothriocephalus latus]